VNELLVSLAVGLLANMLWFVVELVIESVRTREENPPNDSDDE